MTTYTFHSLSDSEFELLVRDLMDVHLDVKLEAFARGADGGIDLRSVGDGGKTIIQCKHYVRSKFTDLARAIRDEVPKLKVLSPQPERYLIVTSLPLSPAQKTELRKPIARWCPSEDEIITPDRLNKLLDDHHEIEQRHPKLWLASVPILQQVLHQGIYEASNAELEVINEKFHLYVVEPNTFRHVRSILKREHWCVIAGNPGVGKSTLAGIAIVDHVRQGYEPVFVRHDIEQLWDAWDADRKQIFCYDDFLGTTRFEPKGRNEDQRLLTFIDKVHKSPNKRFILTTREYILRQALQSSDKLKRTLGLDVALCTVDLNRYAALTKAQILYNHLYFADLPDHFRAPFRNKATYLPVINHRHFHPRLVEDLTAKLPYNRAWTGKQYVDQFMKALEDPAAIWRDLFVNQLTPAAQSLLLSMVTMLSQPVREKELRQAFTAFNRRRAEVLNQQRSATAFRDALGETEGIFLTSTIRDDDIRQFALRSRTLRDFLEHYVSEEPEEYEGLIETAVFPDQLERLCSILEFKLDHAHACSLLQKLEHLLTTPSLTFSAQHVYGLHTYPEEFFDLVVPLWEQTPTPALQPFIQRVTDRFIEYLQSAPAHRPEYAAIIGYVAVGDVPGEVTGGRLHQALWRAMIGDVAADPPDIEDMFLLAEIVQRYPDVVPATDKAHLRLLFEGMARYELEDIWPLGDRQMMESDLEELDYIASVLGVDLGAERQALGEWIATRPYTPEDEDNDEVAEYANSDDAADDPDEDDAGEIDSMFLHFSE